MSLIGQSATVMGAGIAGLAVARALALRGAEVTVLEQAAALGEVGAGLQISPNGAAVLHALGLGPALRDAALRASGVRLCDGLTGATVLHMDLARLRPDLGWHLVHRADLVALLAKGARAAGVTVVTDTQVHRVDLRQDRTVALTPDGRRIVSGLLVGADGLNSILRSALNTGSAPFFTGQVAWRALIPGTPDDPAEVEVHMGPGRHLVSYPLRGGALRNIVAVEERSQWTAEGWNHPDSPDALRRAFAGFGPRVRGWLDAVDDTWLWGLYRHPVAARWYQALPHGGAAILGDAAHPTLPFLAQGANMALEDAWVLAARLAGADTVAAGLAAYQAARRDRCARIVAAANSNARAYHLSGLTRTLGHVALRTAGALAPGLMLRRFDWLYRHDVTKG
jgi:salicylate hydroxylase